MAEFERALIEAVSAASDSVIAWCVLPNHYHLLISTGDLKATLAEVGRMHGRVSHAWNGEDDTRGRKMWCGCADRAIRSERHLWTAINYVHHNPVRHGYVRRWQEWPFSSAPQFLEKVGRVEAQRLWTEYPLLDFGKGWDDPHL
jgi:putative transposase